MKPEIKRELTDMVIDVLFIAAFIGICVLLFATGSPNEPTNSNVIILGGQI